MEKRTAKRARDQMREEMETVEGAAFLAMMALVLMWMGTLMVGAVKGWDLGYVRMVPGGPILLGLGFLLLRWAVASGGGKTRALLVGIILVALFVMLALLTGGDLVPSLRSGGLLLGVLLLYLALYSLCWGLVRKANRATWVAVGIGLLVMLALFVGALAQHSTERHVPTELTGAEEVAPIESPSDVVACPQCHGSASVDGPVQRIQIRCYYCSGLRMARCNLCNGTGQVRNPAGLYLRCYKCGGDGLRPCHVCNGTGWQWHETHPQVQCAYCRGTGKVTRRQRDYWSTHYGGR